MTIQNPAREREGLIQNPATESEEVFKIQQERERGGIQNPARESVSENEESE